MARFDKYDPVSGGFRAPLNAAYTGAAAPLGVGINASGRVVAGAGATGVVGVICQPADKAAGDYVDVMTQGEIVELGGVAGTVYYAHATTGAISSTASLYRVGHAVEAERLVVRMAPPDTVAAANMVTGDQSAITHLTDSTGQTPDNTIGNVAASVIAAAAATAVTDAMLTDGTVDAAGVNAELATLAADIITKTKAGIDTVAGEIEASLSDLAAKVNSILTTLENSGLLTP